MKNTETTYRVIGFGTNQHGHFNQFHFFGGPYQAEVQFQELFADPEMTGAVIIEVQHETWRVINEFGTEGYTVEYGPVGNFKVMPAAKLVLV